MQLEFSFLCVDVEATSCSGEWSAVGIGYLAYWGCLLRKEGSFWDSRHLIKPSKRCDPFYLWMVSQKHRPGNCGMESKTSCLELDLPEKTSGWNRANILHFSSSGFLHGWNWFRLFRRRRHSIKGAKKKSLAVRGGLNVQVKLVKICRWVQTRHKWSVGLGVDALCRFTRNVDIKIPLQSRPRSQN